MWIAIKSIKDDTSKTTNMVNNIECQVKTNRDDIAELRDEITLLKAHAKRDASSRLEMWTRDPCSEHLNFSLNTKVQLYGYHGIGYITTFH